MEGRTRAGWKADAIKQRSPDQCALKNQQAVTRAGWQTDAKQRSPGQCALMRSVEKMVHCL